jgi:outer membrane lipopolysaccharide assembly protein LptE/RlpB
MNKAILIIVMLMLTGCDQQYRYACQNPANWDKDKCKKPYCDINKECPEHIFKKTEKGACK